MDFTIHDTPAEIVKAFPKASDLFKENQIDFCCNGDISLQEQLTNHLADPDVLLADLNQRYADWKTAGNVAKNWDEVPLDELIDHIVHHHHAYLYEELPALSEYVMRINRVHGREHPHLKDLYRLFHTFKMDMEEHTLKEEQEVFPLIEQYIANPTDTLLAEIRQANAQLEAEHDAAGDILKSIRTITKGFQTPGDACNTYRITYDRLAELEENTFQHVHLENNVLFKQL